MQLLCEAELQTSKTFFIFKNVDIIKMIYSLFQVRNVWHIQCLWAKWIWNWFRIWFPPGEESSVSGQSLEENEVSILEAVSSKGKSENRISKVVRLTRLQEIRKNGKFVSEKKCFHGVFYCRRNYHNYYRKKKYLYLF